MTYTIEQLLTLNEESFKNMKKENLLETFEQLKLLKKQKTKDHIKPMVVEKIKPIEDKFIKPLKEKHIKPINKVIKVLKTFLPKLPQKKAYLTINGTRYGPMTKRDFMDMIIEIDEEKK